MAHFKKYWDASLQDEVVELVQMKVFYITLIIINIINLMNYVFIAVH
jgi:hypothetical protein